MSERLPASPPAPPAPPRRAVLLAAVLLLGGCAALRGPPAPLAGHLDAGDRAGDCARLFQALNRTVDAAGTGDAQAARIAGFPYLRVSRFLAGGVEPALQGTEFEAWVDRLRALDRAARRRELANLPAETPLPGALAGAAHPAAVLDRCAALLRDADLGTAPAREQLREAARVPSEYSLLARTLGLYPLTSIAFEAGVRGLHRRTRDDFSTPLRELPVRGTLRRFRPASGAPVLGPAQVAGILRRSARNPLHVPQPRGSDRRRLFAAFAPVWEVDVAGSADRIGTPRWTSAPFAQVDTARPAVFEHLSHARFDGRILLQLNYVIWFPARPRTGPLDLLGGHLDGITWRVTLGADGRPLLYDAMHNCGCYHMYFPTPRLRQARRQRGWEEPLLVPQEVADAAGRVVVRIAQRTHYLQRVYHDPEAGRGQPYAQRDYDELRSLPLPDGGRRSLFGPDGIVAGSERRERWLFWPMGIPDPGAMRQWGHHATAFVGRRYFDDPHLIERYFALAEPQ